MREKNTLSQKLLIIVAALVFVISLCTLYVYTEKHSASYEEMHMEAEMIIKVYYKLEPEEFKLIAGNSGHLVHPIPNKDWGKLIVLGDSNGNIGVRFDYQRTEKIFVIFSYSVVSALISALLFNGIYQITLVKRLKKENE